jgi:crossover junction endonuclease MUS81
MTSTCANPLLLQWLEEWWDTAKVNNGKDQLTYKKACDSMKANPIVFAHPSEAIQLKGIGPKLVERLTQRMEVHCRANGLPIPTKARTSK